LKPDGNGKLSKRDADQMGFPIFPLNWQDPVSAEMATGFKESGYLPEAMINFLAFLGWNPGTEQEIFSMDQLIQAFTIERIGKAGAKFDIHKAQWFNQQYLRALPPETLSGYLLDALANDHLSCDLETASKICAVMKERATFPNDFYQHGKFFFTPPATFDMAIVNKKWTPEAVKVLIAFSEELSFLESIDANNAKILLDQVTSKLGISTGKILQALRLSITGGASGPDLMMTIEIIGPAQIAKRIQHAINTLQVVNAG